jgi:hypothetical protein
MMRITRSTAPTAAQNRQSETKFGAVTVVVVLDVVVWEELVVVESG